RSPSTPVLRGELAAAVWDQVDAVLRLEAEGIEVRIQALEESLADALLLGDDRGGDDADEDQREDGEHPWRQVRRRLLGIRGRHRLHALVDWPPDFRRD